MALKQGWHVAAAPAAFDGADPFTRYIVAAVHRDGTVDLATPGQPDRPVATRVKARHLTHLK